ncbi:MAG: hypothetical protein Fur006_02720 [Coleofasciculaceae cyanobacterium]
MTFTITQNNNNSELLKSLFGNLGALEQAGIYGFNVKFTGDARALGVFQDDPFGLNSGIVLSTGRVIDLAGKNTKDGGFSLGGTTVPLTFEKLTNLTGIFSDPKTAVYRADLSRLGFDLKSLSIADSGSGTGGAGGRFSGFDLDAIKLSNTLITDAKDVNAISGLDVFDFSPARTVFTPGTQRPSSYVQPDLYGTNNGNINNSVATLEKFDGDPSTSENTSGGVSLGDGGKVGFNLKQPVSTSGKPLYLYIGEVGDNGEVASGQISVSNKTISELSDVGTDFGQPGSNGDSISLQIDFFVSGSEVGFLPPSLAFNYVFGSEELVEYAGKPNNDAFSIKLNGFNLAKLTDKSAVSINNLAANPYGGYNSDFIYNPAGTGPAANQTTLDGYTKNLTFTGSLKKGLNSLVINIKDGGDGLLDSAVFIQNSISIKDYWGNNIVGCNSGVNLSSTLDSNALNLSLTPEINQNFNLDLNPSVNPSNKLDSNALNLSLAPQVNPGLNLITNNISTIIGTDFNDSLSLLTGTNNPDEIYGLDGDDWLNGQGGDDYLDGGNGNDRIWGGAGDDYLMGGNGRDWMLGGADNDILHGDNNDDALDGGLGNDTLDGGTGNDVMSGRAGDDTYYVDSFLDQVNEYAAEGRDTIYASVDYTMPDNVENLILTDNAIQGIGNNLDNSIYGNNLFLNTLFGEGGNDSLYGGDGIDNLLGDAGNDFLLGGNGNDRLVGVSYTFFGSGEIDRLTGNDGGDSFILGLPGIVFYNDGNFSTNGISDYAVITDFQVAQGIGDVIQLGGTVSNYVLKSSPIAVGSDAADTAIYLKNSNSADELIGVVQDVSGLSLSSNAFSFV